PGIGQAMASAIISYREQHGAFNATEDLMLVPGIKEGRFSQIESLITVGAP
ncbi:MAG: helix-hairpin-helix domain-containing protein, partial [Spirochaetales bacterium]|nr:helix-hairpin-helix domain-containing protein [Spirochaetales bacterium]